MHLGKLSANGWQADFEFQLSAFPIHINPRARRAAEVCTKDAAARTIALFLLRKIEPALLCAPN